MANGKEQNSLLLYFGKGEKKHNGTSVSEAVLRFKKEHQAQISF